AVADTAGLGGTPDGVDGLFDHVVAQHNFDFHLGKEIHHVLGAAIEFGMALLPAEALGFRHRDALQTDLLQRFLHLVELEGFDDGLDFFHRVSVSPSASSRPRMRGSVSRLRAKTRGGRKSADCERLAQIGAVRDRSVITIVPSAWAICLHNRQAGASHDGTNEKRKSCISSGWPAAAPGHAGAGEPGSMIELLTPGEMAEADRLTIA